MSALHDTPPGLVPEERLVPIGELIARRRQLNGEQLAAIAAHQRSSGQRFGQAAVTLGHAGDDDVLAALSQQFRYPVTASRSGSPHPFSPELVMLHQPFAARAEEFRRLRSQLSLRLFAQASRPPCLAVVSAAAGDGRSLVAANLALALAQLGGSTLLVDANLRQPRLHSLFGADTSLGLSSLLAGRAGLEVVQPVLEVPGLSLLPGGALPPNPLELVENASFAALMTRLAAGYTHVVVDTPAASAGADASVIAAACGAALVVLRRHASRLEEVRQLLASMQHGRVQVAGCVMNEH